MTRKPTRPAPRRSTAPRRAPAPVVEWRDGVHLVGTPLWCDARRAREASFVSSALAPDASKHRQAIATATTIEILAALKKPPRGALPVPFGRPFTLGDVRLELFPAGVVPGAASLQADVRGRRVVYAGTVDPRGEGLPGAAEIRTCDVLIIDATFAAKRFRFPPAARAVVGLAGWVDATLAAEATPVVLAEPLAAGALVWRALAPGYPLRAHPAFLAAAKALAGAGFEMPPLRRFAGTPAPGEVVLWPLDAHDSRALRGVRRPRLAVAGPWAPDAAALAAAGAVAGFPVAAQAGHDELDGYVTQSGAREIYLLHGDDALAAALSARGLTAHVLGPPRQLSLF